MVDAITIETAHLLGDAMVKMYRLRYRVFVVRQHYDVPTLRGMEWDQFDTPAAVYLLWHNEGGELGGVARLIPTTSPYMIATLWPHMVADGALPSAPDTWELSRLGVDRSLPKVARKRAIGELMCACGEFALRSGIKTLLVVTAPHLVTGAIAGAGWRAEVCGAPCNLGRFKVVAAKTHVTEEGLESARRFHGISHSVLRIVGEEIGSWPKGGNCSFGRSGAALSTSSTGAIERPESCFVPGGSSVMRPEFTKITNAFSGSNSQKTVPGTMQSERVNDFATVGF
jgi:acyl homoserine lactone synthase